jgi:hypothetical protein
VGFAIVIALAALSYIIPAAKEPALEPKHNPDEQSSVQVQTDQSRAVPDPPPAAPPGTPIPVKPFVSKKSPLEESLEIREKEYGHFYIGKADGLYRVAELYTQWGDYKRAEANWKRLLHMEARIFGANSHRVAMDLGELAKLYKKTGNMEALARTNQLICKLPYNGLGDEPGFGEALIKHSRQMPPASTLQMDRDTILHPILKSWAGHGLEGKVPPKGVYFVLNNYSDKSLLQCDWDRYFYAAEHDAAVQFCREVDGLTKIEVEKLAGKPCYKGGAINCWKFLKPNDEVWVYKFGESAIATRVIFRNNACKEAAVCSHEERFDFDDWRITQIRNYALWKSVNQIIEKEGPPIGSPAIASAPRALWPDIKTEKIIYRSGSHTATLYFKWGICFKTEEGWEI